MTREVQDIPPAPRSVRWRAVLWHRWPLAFLGFVLAVYGGSITLMLFLASGGKPLDDYKLDRDCVHVPGEITEVVEPSFEGQPVRILYKFKPRNRAGNRYSEGTSLHPHGSTFREGQRITIECVQGEPHINRAEGGRISILPPLREVFFYAVLLPGLACLSLWFTWVLLLRRLMAHGDIAVGDVVAIRPIPYVLPLMMSVRYSFRDHHAAMHTVRHWVRTRSELGERLLSNPKRIAVIHDRSGKGVSRLVMASDFVSRPADTSPQDVP